MVSLRLYIFSSCFCCAFLSYPSHNYFKWAGTMVSLFFTFERRIRFALIALMLTNQIRNSFSCRCYLCDDELSSEKCPKLSSGLADLRKFLNTTSNTEEPAPPVDTDEKPTVEVGEKKEGGSDEEGWKVVETKNRHYAIQNGACGEMPVRIKVCCSLFSCWTSVVEHSKNNITFACLQ